jgi:hypothetical protein
MELLILAPAQVDALGTPPTLRPIPIAAGSEAGNGALNPRVLDDPVQEPFWSALRQGRMVDLDLEDAWPVQD